MDVVSYVLAKNAGKGAAERVASSIAAAYNSSQAYAKDDLVIYDGALWKAITVVPAGAWDATKWMQTTVADYLDGASCFFIVTISYGEEDWIADHSAADCFAAREAGKQVLFKIEQGESMVVYVEGQVFAEESNTITASFVMGNVVYSGSLIGTSVALTQKFLSNIDSLAPTYSSSNQYLVDDVVNYNGSIYQANTAITVPESFNEDHWNLTNIWEAITKILHYNQNN